MRLIHSHQQPMHNYNTKHLYNVMKSRASGSGEKGNSDLNGESCHNTGLCNFRKRCLWCLIRTWTALRLGT